MWLAAPDGTGGGAGGVGREGGAAAAAPAGERLILLACASVRERVRTVSISLAVSLSAGGARLRDPVPSLFPPFLSHFSGKLGVWPEHSLFTVSPGYACSRSVHVGCFRPAKQRTGSTRRRQTRP